MSALFPVRAGRVAAATMFFANGFLMGSWAPQIPELMRRLAIGETMLGLLILVFGVGALVAMPACGMAMARYGSRNVLRGFALASIIGLLVVALADNLSAAVPALFVLGAVVGAMDVAMNTNAVAVERALSRAVMSSMHGFWSLGGVAGGALGGLAIERFGHLAHAGGVTLILGLLIGVAALFLIEEDRLPRPAGVRMRLPRQPSIYLVGLLALFAMIPEGAVLDWAAVYLQQELGASIATAGFAFAAFSATMAAVRFAGDGIRRRLGAVRTLRISSLIAAAGVLGAGLAPDPWVAIVAFAVAGLGVANIVPIAFSAAGNQPGLTASTGMSVVTTMGYSGILLAPSAVGFLAERFGFTPVFVAMAALLALVCAMAGLARNADFGRIHTSTLPDG